MINSHFRLADIFLVVAIGAIGCFIYRSYVGGDYLNARLFFSINIGLLTVAITGIFIGNNQWRAFYAGYSLFGSLFLVTLLRGGYGWPNNVYGPSNDLTWHAQISIWMALAFGLLCQVIHRPRGENCPTEKKNI